MKTAVQSRRLGIRVVFLVCLIPALFTCGQGSAEKEDTSTPARMYMLQDFESDWLWSLDSANNYGTVAFSSTHATSGKKSMKVRFVANGRHNTMFRREVDYDLSSVERLVIDVFNHATAPGVKLGLAFKTRDGGFFETVTRSLRPGWNRSFEFRIGKDGMKPATEAAKWQVGRADVERIMFLVYPGENRDGFLSIDNLRCDAPSVDRQVTPVLVSSGNIPDTTRQWRPVELEFEFESESLLMGNEAADELAAPLMPVDIQMRLALPDHGQHLVKGFLMEKKAAEKKKPATVTYGVRFTPTMPGDWYAKVDLKAGKVWKTLQEKSFACTPEPKAPGMIGIDREDPMFFSFANGEFFYPIGQNICWAADYEPYFKAIKQYRGNIARIWICPWNNPLLKKHDFRSIDLESADEWDKVFDLARKSGVYVQLVLSHHGALADEWDRSPFNSENGGPCVLPQDFWVDKDAKQAFKDYLAYVIARWANRPNLFAWELMNEANLTPRYGDHDLISWHREMSKFIRTQDPYDHPVTTSLNKRDSLGELFEGNLVDFTNSHFYAPNVTGRLNQEYVFYKRYNKPYFVGEMGRGWRAESDQVDRNGVHLHHSLWLAWMTPASGNALPWWWDTHIEPNNLQYHFAALTAFGRGQDRRGQNYRGWMKTISQENRSNVQIQGLVNRTSVFAFVYSLDLIKDPNATHRETMLENGHKITLEGMLDGKYKMEIVNTYTGKVVGAQHLSCEDGVLIIPLPEAPGDFALKVRYNGAPGLTVSVE